MIGQKQVLSVKKGKRSSRLYEIFLLCKLLEDYILSMLHQCRPSYDRSRWKTILIKKGFHQQDFLQETLWTIPEDRVIIKGGWWWQNDSHNWGEQEKMSWENEERLTRMAERLWERHPCDVTQQQRQGGSNKQIVRCKQTDLFTADDAKKSINTQDG